MKYFSIKELCASDTATRLRIDNTPSSAVKHNLTKLVDAVLDPLREYYGKPITISSGYRCPALNAAVGGVSTSQHKTGQAVDIQIVNKDGSINTAANKELYNIIVQRRLPFDQVILEKGTKDNPIWIHVSYDETRNRRQKLYFNGKKYISI